MSIRCFRRLAVFAFLMTMPALVSCSSDEASDDGGGSATGGTGPTGGSGGSTSGAAGAPGGSGGTASGGTASGGTASGGTAGSPSGGTAGTSTGGSGGAPGGAGGGSGAGASTGGSAGAGGGGGGAPGGVGGGGTGPGGTGGASGKGGAGGTGGSSTFTVTSPAFANMPGCAANMAASCATFPRDNTSFGANVSPAMTWTGAPAGTQSFVVLMQDLTNGMAHWVLWNIPASVTSLPENISKTSAMPAVPAGSQQCSIGQGDGYFGSGACGNVYEFVIYALSIPTFSPTQATNQTQVRMQLQALGAQILGTASMRARSSQPEC
jgi:Raf kinase inhibitor-like YbhB/YbcL family protein